MGSEPHPVASDAGPLVLRGRVVLPDAVLSDGVVVVTGTRITWVGDAPAAPPSVAPHLPAAGTSRTLLPGLVDLHCHGGGGAGFPDAADAAEALVAVHEHRRHGTTTLLASLVTASAGRMVAQAARLAPLVVAGEIAGLHAEGPFLSAVRCGAQDPAHLTDGDPDLVRELDAAAGGGLATMTVAPEVPGADDVLSALVAAGAVPSVGHTDASAQVTTAALRLAHKALTAAGRPDPRPTVTHLFNGMAPLHHRSPGAVAACLAAAARGQAVLELVGDGVHLAPETVRTVFDLVGADGIALVTDAMAATGMPDGAYDLGPARVRVVDGLARLGDGPRPEGAGAGGAGAGGSLEVAPLAGGTAHLLDVVRRTVAAGVTLVDAVTAASATPASVLGRPDVGRLAAGCRADVVVVDEDLHPVRVMRAGRWVDERPAEGTTT